MSQALGPALQRGGGHRLAEFRLCAVSLRGGGGGCGERNGQASPAAPTGAWLCPNLADSQALVISVPDGSDVMCLMLFCR